MKKLVFILPVVFVCFIIFFFTACSQTSVSDGIVKINLLDSTYPVKEINLKEIADISYICFDSHEDNQLFRGGLLALTDQTVVFADYRKGDIHFFSRTGKFISKFNRRGDAPEEYNSIRGGIYNEKNDELFILTTGKKYRIKVYDHAGNYKRVLDFPDETLPSNIVDWDDTSFLLYDAYRDVQTLDRVTLTKEIECENCYPSSFVRVSKKDGTFIEAIPVLDDYSYMVGRRIDNQIIPGPKYRLIKHNEGYLLCSSQTDTIYYYDKELSLTPVWVTTPAAKDMVTNMINGFVEAGNYQFFEKILLEGDVLPIPSIYLVRDKETDKTYTQKIVFDEYKGYDFIISPRTVNRVTKGKTGYISLTVGELKDAYEEDRLSGPLKELVKDMHEEDNDIFMILHFK